jgi:hypothetical protein
MTGKELLLLKRIKSEMPVLEDLLQKVNDHWGYEDSVFRFYHQSFKVYRLQEMTKEIRDELLCIGGPLHPYFETLYARGTDREFSMESNAKWLEETAPIVEAFFHAKYFLEMAVKYGKEMDGDKKYIKSGYASLLALYQI